MFDQNLSLKLCQHLADLFPGSSQVRLLSPAQTDDKTIWQYAKDNAFVLVAQDSDFAEMAALYGQPPKIIWFRCGNQPTDVVEKRPRNHAHAISAFEKDPTTSCLEIL